MARRRGHRRRRSWSTGNRWRKGSPVRKSARRRSQGSCWPNMQARLYRIRAASRRPADRKRTSATGRESPMVPLDSPPSSIRKLARRFGARERSSNQYAYRRCPLARSGEACTERKTPHALVRSSAWLVALAPFSVLVPFRIRETNRPLYRRRPGVPPRRPARLSVDTRHPAPPCASRRSIVLGLIHPAFVEGTALARRPMAER